MNREEYFLNAVVSDAILLKHWGLSLFAVTKDVEEGSPYPWKIKRTDTEVLFYHSPSDKWLPLEGVEVDEPLCHPRDLLQLPKGILVNAPNGCKDTTFGCVFVNQLIFCLPFGDRIPYQNGYIDAKVAYELVERHLVDDPKEGEKIPEGAVTVSQYQMFGEHVNQLVSFNDVVVHYVTPKSMLIHPLAMQLKKELMEKYKDQLTDPVIIAKIGAALEALDREFIKDDPIMDFYTSSKYIGKVRKKLFYMFGAEGAFEDSNDVSFIPNSLREGIDVNYLPQMINASRYGSYSRGALTQLGGARAKETTRATGNLEITSVDCGTKLGITTVIFDDSDKYSYVGQMMIKDGKTIELTPALIEQHLNKEIVLRSPLYCREDATGVSYCEKCIGAKLAAAPSEIPSVLIGVSGIFTKIFLAAFHGTELITRPFDPKLCIF